MLPFFGRCLSPILESSSFCYGVEAAAAAVRRLFTSGVTVTPDPDSQVESMALWGTVALPCGVWTPSVERPSDLQPVYERLGFGGPPTGSLHDDVKRFDEAICLRTSA